ncbi:MAG: PorT family protein [Saprospiraceae bacterium]|nr:PorT family protein [Saprospiraceae bacterium]
MRRIIVFIIFSLNAYYCHSQLDFTVTGGMHSIDVGPKDFVVTNKSELDSFKFSFKNASYGYHFGIGLRINLNNFYLHPEFIFNSNNAHFKVNNYNVPQLVDSARDEKYQYLDIPLMLGVKFNIIRLYAGPVAHIFINNNSELTDIDGYKDKFKTASFGYQAGIGFELFNLIGIDIRHEGNFSQYGDHINFFGSQLNFDKKASRLIGSISLIF